MIDEIREREIDFRFFPSSLLLDGAREVDVEQRLRCISLLCLSVKAPATRRTTNETSRESSRQDDDGRGFDGVVL